MGSCPARPEAQRSPSPSTRRRSGTLYITGNHQASLRARRGHTVQRRTAVPYKIQTPPVTTTHCDQELSCRHSRASSSLLAPARFKLQNLYSVGRENMSNQHTTTLPEFRLYKVHLFFFLRFYLFIHETHRERQRHRQREKQAPCREPDVGLDPGSSGSCPGLKAALNR